jgi:uncharacterized protein (DUF433 family)
MRTRQPLSPSRRRRPRCVSVQTRKPHFDLRETARDYTTRIVVDSRIHFGKPCVAGTRIPVENVLELIQEGIPFAEIITQYYSDLTIEDVKACAASATALVRSEEIHLETV